MTTTHLVEKRSGRLLLLVAALVGALLFEFIFFKHWGGIGAFLFVFFFSTLLLAIVKYYKLIRNEWAMWFLIVPFVLSVDLMFYNNELVTALAPFFIILSLLLFVFTVTVSHPEGRTLFRFRKIPFPRVFHGIGRAVQDLTESPTQEKKRVLVKILIGLIIAAPLVLIFGSLFADADRNFANLINDIFSFDIDEEVFFRIVRIAFLTLVMSAVAYSIIDPKFVLKSAEKVAKKFDTTIVLTVMVILNILFLIFVALQFQNLFVSYQYILDNSIVFAEYARRGFFELLWVTGLALALFLFIFRSFSEHGMNRVIKGALIIFLVLTVVVAYSALHKMNLYQEAYGFTVQRFYAEIIIYFIMISLALGIFWIVTERKFARLFYAGMILAAIVLLFSLSLNVDAIIAQKNLTRAASEGKSLDVRYLRSLSLDVAPTVYDFIISGDVAKLPYEAQSELYEEVGKYYDYGRANRYLDFNWARFQAIQASMRAGLGENSSFNEQKNKVDKFKQEINYARSNSVSAYGGVLGRAEESSELVRYQILPKFTIKPWAENERGWSWPPHITVLRALPGQSNYQYVNDIILYTDQEHEEMRREYSTTGVPPYYVFLLRDGLIWKFDHVNLTQEKYRVRFNGKKFELYKIVD